MLQVVSARILFLTRGVAYCLKDMMLLSEIWKRRMMLWFSRRMLGTHLNFTKQLGILRPSSQNVRKSKKFQENIMPQNLSLDTWNAVLAIPPKNFCKKTENSTLKVREQYERLMPSKTNLTQTFFLDRHVNSSFGNPAAEIYLPRCSKKFERNFSKERIAFLKVLLDR